MRSCSPGPALRLLRTPLAEPGGDGLAGELVELCRCEPELHISSSRTPGYERLLARHGFRRARTIDLPQPVVASMLLNRTYRGLQLLKHRPAHFGHQLRYSGDYQFWVRL